MSKSDEPEIQDTEYKEAQKRVKKIKKFYKDLASWGGTSIALLAMDFFLSGGITWSKYPVIFWGIWVIAQVFDVIRLQRLDKNWEERQIKKFTSRKSLSEDPTHSSAEGSEKLEDYSEELLNKKDREMEKLSEYRRLAKPWKDEDLV